MSKILIVEDEEAIADLEKDYLELSGFTVEVANDGDTGLQKALNEDYDLLILDLMLPGTDGFDICRQVREVKNTPIVMVSAKKDDIDKIRGLGLGADDYMTKPFLIRELIARMNKILSKSKTNKIKIKDITIDLDKMMVYKNEKEISLTALETKLLIYMFSNSGKILKRECIIEKIWDWTRNDVNDNTISVYIKRIREKLDTDIIVTIKGIGYMVKNDEK